MIALSHHIGNQKFSQQCRHISTERRKILELLPRHYLRRLVLSPQQAVHGTDFGIPNTFRLKRFIEYFGQVYSEVLRKIL